MATKYDKYNEIKRALEIQGVGVSAYQEINYGIQFDIEINEQRSKVRIYESKKGIKLDLSTVKYEALKDLLLNINSTKTSTAIIRSEKKELGHEIRFQCDQLENALIGVDESGKGDYFGPLVIAGVYGDKESKLALEKLGVMDSKALTDKKIRELAIKIKGLCPYNIVVVGNETYNSMYQKINNLNKLLAWGHARVIENLLGEVKCDYALSDQFGNESFIKNALMEKGRAIKLEQRPRAEENVVVAAASILARDQFLAKLQEMNQNYGMVFPKGASQGTIKAAKCFAEKFGKNELEKVSKLHFKTTNNI